MEVRTCSKMTDEILVSRELMLKRYAMEKKQAKGDVDGGHGCKREL
jgi:hypothetical protein